MLFLCFCFLGTASFSRAIVFFEQQRGMNLVSSHLHVFSLPIQSFVKQSGFFNTEKQPCCIDLF